MCASGHHSLENALDIVDRRTLISLLRCAGFSIVHPLPATGEEFLERQTLITDPVHCAPLGCFSMDVDGLNRKVSPTGQSAETP